MKKKINILHFTVSDEGGAGKACVRLHRGLMSHQKINSKVLVISRESNDEKECFQLYSSKKKLLFFSILNSIYSKIMLGFKSNKYKNFKFSGPVSFNRIHKHNLFDWADIINLHWVGNSLDYSSFFEKINKPIVWTLHDMNPFSGGNHYKFGFPEDVFSTITKKNINIKSSALKNKNLTIVALCNWMLNLSSSSLTFKNFQHKIIPNSIDTNVFCYNSDINLHNEYNIKINSKIILFVAFSLSEERKGLSILEKIFNKFTNCTFLIVGDHIKNITSKNVMFLGRINDERLMARIYGGSDLYVIPSLEDNLPNTVLESLCCGLPVVGFNIGGMPDMITNGINGFLSDKISDVSLTQTIKKSLIMDFDKSKISSDAIKKYQTPQQVNNYVSLYESICQKKNTQKYKFIN